MSKMEQAVKEFKDSAQYKALQAKRKVADVMKLRKAERYYFTIMEVNGVIRLAEELIADYRLDEMEFVHAVGEPINVQQLQLV